MRIKACALACALLWASTCSAGVIQVVTVHGSQYAGLDYRATLLSRDGSTVAGTEGHGQSAMPFRWTKATGLVNLGDLNSYDPAQDITTPYGISADGKAIVGYDKSGPYRGFTWDVVNGLQPFGRAVQTDQDMLPLGLSGDGSTVVGHSYDVGGAFRWTAAGGFESLGLPHSLPSLVSHDGSTVIVGNDRWRNGTLSKLPVQGTVTAMSDDASVLVGSDNGAAYHYARGQFSIMGVGLNPLATTSDGSLVLGNNWLWDANNGRRDLLAVLSAEVDLSPWSWISAVALSGDGKHFLLDGYRDDRGEDVYESLLVSLDRSAVPAAVVPEPATWLAWAVLGMAFWGWRRRA